MCRAAGAITVPSRISMKKLPATSSASPRDTLPDGAAAVARPSTPPAITTSVPLSSPADEVPPRSDAPRPGALR